MKQKTQPIQFDWGYGNIRKVIRLIASASDVNDACKILARHLKHIELKLICVNFCNLEGENASIRPYRDMPEALTTLSNQFHLLGVCPIIREAKKDRRPFDALNLNRNVYCEFLEQRFLDELSKLGHRHVLVLPAAFGRGLANVVVGTGEREISLQLQAELFARVGQSLAAIITRFPDITKLFETKCLSTLQAEILFLISIGTSLDDISRLTGRGDLVINALLKNAQERLNANSIPHAVARALALGEFSNMNLGAAI
ncbi:MAG: hypothetical protein AB3N20_14480 [Rhizobiaceae bacterium]